MVFIVLGEDDILVRISITTHLFGSILGSEEGPHHMLALDPLFTTIRPLVIEILSVFIVLREDDILVHISITTHPFDLILGSEEGPCPILFLDPSVCDNATASHQDIISFQCTLKDKHR